MITYTKAQAKKLLKIDFIRFCIVGGTGFVINFALLVLFHRVLGVAVFISQLIGAEIALFSNFILHHHWTYKDKKVEKSLTTLLIQFHASSWVAIVGSALMVTAGESLLHLGNLAALAVSSAIALLWNFGWSKFVIWRGVSETEIEALVK